MRKLFYTFLFISAITYDASAQLNFNIDSLLTVYKNQQLDSLKVITNNKIINFYMYRDPILAKKYAFEQLKMSNEIEFSGGAVYGKLPTRNTI